MVARLSRRLHLLAEDLHDKNLWSKPKNLEKYGLANASPEYRENWAEHHDELFALEEEYREEVEDVPNWYMEIIPDFYGKRNAEVPKGILLWDGIVKCVDYLRYGDGAGGVDLTDPTAVLFYILNARVKDESGTVIFQAEDSEILLEGFKWVGVTLREYLNDQNWGSLASLFDSLVKAFPKNQYFDAMESEHMDLVSFIDDYSAKFLDIALAVAGLRNKMALWMEDYPVVEAPGLED
ncbi:hypothetical protein AA313_de0202095 [Arthrobotrys entomopaga]|nr:hypothetical protein AA313_de0202095 [Arthrobotrys entomopaga]